MACLILLGRRERVFPLAESNRIGRLADLEVTLEDPAGQLSRLHARITLTPDGWWLEDMGSQNGTRVGERVLEPRLPQLLSDRDEIVIGGLRLRFVQEDDSDQAPPLLAALDSSTLATTRPVIREGAPADRRLELLYDLGEAIRRLDDLDGLMETLLRAVIHALNPERAYLGLFDPEVGDWRFERSLVDCGQRREPFLRSRHVIRRAMEEGSAQLIGDALSRGAPGSPSLRAERVRSALCVPLLAGETCIGVLYLDDRRRIDAFTEADLRFVAFLGIFLGRALAGARRLDRQTRARQALEPPLPPSNESRTPAMLELRRRIQAVAATSFPLLLLGETGTGKSTLAREIHRLSPRRDGPFVSINCAAITETLLESELFGYAPKSGIAGADPRGKPGKFELADGGTLFLDEIGDMPTSQQVKLLTAVDEKRIQRLSSRDVSPTRVDVRIIAATSIPLQEALLAGRFRDDLFFRLGRVQLTVPPLRARLEDLETFSARTLEKLSSEVPWRVAGISPAAMEYLKRYPWPGNLRELENVLTHALLECPPGEWIEPTHLPSTVIAHTREGVGIRLRCTIDPGALSEVDREKRERLVTALLETGSQGKAAQRLGYTRQWVIELCQRYGVEVVPNRSGSVASRKGRQRTPEMDR